MAAKLQGSSLWFTEKQQVGKEGVVVRVIGKQIDNNLRMIRLLYPKSYSPQPTAQAAMKDPHPLTSAHPVIQKAVFNAGRLCAWVSEGTEKEEEQQERAEFRKIKRNAKIKIRKM